MMLLEKASLSFGVLDGIERTLSFVASRAKKLNIANRTVSSESDGLYVIGVMLHKFGAALGASSALQNVKVEQLFARIASARGRLFGSTFRLLGPGVKPASIWVGKPPQLLVYGQLLTVFFALLPVSVFVKARIVASSVAARFVECLRVRGYPVCRPLDVGVAVVRVMPFAVCFRALGTASAGNYSMGNMTMRAWLPCVVGCKTSRNGLLLCDCLHRRDCGRGELK